MKTLHKKGKKLSPKSTLRMGLRLRSTHLVGWAPGRTQQPEGPWAELGKPKHCLPTKSLLERVWDNRQPLCWWTTRITGSCLDSYPSFHSIEGKKNIKGYLLKKNFQRVRVFPPSKWMFQYGGTYHLGKKTLMKNYLMLQDNSKQGCCAVSPHSGN